MTISGGGYNSGQGKGAVWTKCGRTHEPGDVGGRPALRHDARRQEALALLVGVLGVARPRQLHDGGSLGGAWKQGAENQKKRATRRASKDQQTLRTEDCTHGPRRRTWSPGSRAPRWGCRRST